MNTLRNVFLFSLLIITFFSGTAPTLVYAAHCEGLDTSATETANAATDKKKQKINDLEEKKTRFNERIKKNNDEYSIAILKEKIASCERSITELQKTDKETDKKINDLNKEKEDVEIRIRKQTTGGKRGLTEIKNMKNQIEAFDNEIKDRQKKSQ